MPQKDKFQLEYPIKCSARVLFNRLSTPGGLSEWFADDVNVSGEGIFTFIWDKFEQQASLVNIKEGSFVRFRWLDDDEKIYFEFRIAQDELTGDVSLIITDFAESDEKEDSIELWDTQIANLKKVLGS